MSKNSLFYWNKWQMSDTNKNYELQPLQNEGMYPKYSFLVHIIFFSKFVAIWIFETICTIDKTNTGCNLHKNSKYIFLGPNHV